MCIYIYIYIHVYIYIYNILHNVRVYTDGRYSCSHKTCDPHLAETIITTTPMIITTTTTTTITTTTTTTTTIITTTTEAQPAKLPQITVEFSSSGAAAATNITEESNDNTHKQYII